MLRGLFVNASHRNQAFSNWQCLLFCPSLEVGSCIAVQVCMIQIPLLILFNAFYVRNARLWFHTVSLAFALQQCSCWPGSNPFPPSQDVGFTLIFSDIHLWASIFSVILVNYIFMDGKSDYFQGKYEFQRRPGAVFLSKPLLWINVFENCLFFPPGTALVVVYLILLAVYYFAPSPPACWDYCGDDDKKKTKKNNIMQKTQLS